MKRIGTKKRNFLIVGIALILIALGLGALDLYHVTQYEKVEAQLVVVRKNSSGKKAHVSYEYQGVKYEDKALSSYNAFTMKNGKTYTVLIDPKNPDTPHATSFTLEILFFAFGVISVLAWMKEKKE